MYNCVSFHLRVPNSEGVGKEVGGEGGFGYVIFTVVPVGGHTSLIRTIEN